MQVEALSHDLGGARVGAAEAAEQHGERGANDCTEEVEHEQDRLGSGDAQRGRLSCRTCAGYRQSRAKQGRRQGLCKERRRRSDPTNQGSKRQAERGNRFYKAIHPYWMHTGNEERSEHSPETRSDGGALGLDRDGRNRAQSEEKNWWGGASAHIEGLDGVVLARGCKGRLLSIRIIRKYRID